MEALVFYFMKVFILILLLNDTPIGSRIYTSQITCENEAKLINSVADWNSKAVCLENQMLRIPM